MLKSPVDDDDQIHLFSYEFRGARYSLEVPAKSPAEAQFRLTQMANAAYDGVVHLKLGAATGPISGFLAKLGL